MNNTRTVCRRCRLDCKSFSSLVARCCSESRSISNFRRSCREIQGSVRLPISRVLPRRELSVRADAYLALDLLRYAEGTFHSSLSHCKEKDEKSEIEGRGLAYRL